MRWAFKMSNLAAATALGLTEWIVEGPGDGLGNEYNFCEVIKRDK
jgi:hypothetical protein